tara:strand:- start:1112 stop:1672 length:561 start_codon:yes stop_codon:yes gene_type:complete
MKLKRSTIRKLIIQEINKIKEDALKSGFDDPGRQDLYKSTQNKRSCSECGSAMYENESVCEQCGNMYEENTSLNEGDCGCGGNTKSPTVFPISDFSNLDDINILTPGEASGVGYEASNFDHSDRHDNNYMAKPSLYKVAKYATKLLEMIPDGHELDDWQRTKIAQISDDISEVYHSLDYDKFEGDL